MKIKKETDNETVFARIKYSIKRSLDGFDNFMRSTGSFKSINDITGQKDEELYKPSAEEITAEANRKMPPEKDYSR